jgi:hypothetical protein
MSSLRFAPIIRVSTEKQEKKGESLRTQTKQVKDYVNYLKGVIPPTAGNTRGRSTPPQTKKERSWKSF